MNPIITSDIDMPSPQPESDYDEKQDVATITTDEVQPMEEDLPSADDHEAMKRKFLPSDPDLETLDEQMTKWRVDGYSRLEQKMHSPTFTCGDTPWRLLTFPFGNNNAQDWCSCYLEHNFPEDKKPAETWYTCIQFLIVAYNPNDPSIFVSNTASHRYSPDATDWGFNKFFELRKAMHGWHEQGGRPLLENDSLTFDIYVRTVKDPTGVLWHSFDNYDSKKETGMIGLKNQGATCYLNSLLQSLYLTNAFRKAIYQIPTEEETNARGNSAYALQRLFYQLQHFEKAASTDELTSAFGWDTRQTFVQQDVQELARLLMDNMEERLKGTPHDKDLSNLFVGSTKTFLECINVDYESSSSQVFWDVQLNVRGQKSLDESFKNNLQVETMDGDNKYFAEGYGLQDARKGDIYEHFPPVLHLQLKRFEFNWEYNAPTKINDRLEFPEQFDASPYLSKDADRSEPWIYNLHGVLVHSGDLDAGHYYAFLKPSKDGHFYKFDDDRVTRATKKEAIDENFGGEFSNKVNGAGGMQKNPFTFKYTKHRFMSAYMLVYIRQSRLDQVLQPIGDADVPSHLDRKITEEQADQEKRRKEREEAHLYMQLIVGTTANFNAYQGIDIFPAPSSEIVDKAALPKVHRVLKSMKIAEFKTSMAKESGVDAELIRPWALVGRQNHTVRPDTPMDWDDMALDECNQKINGKVPFKIWLETTLRKSDGHADWMSSELIMNHKSPAQPILLFLKYFDIEKQKLLGHSYIYIEKTKRVSELGPVILERMGWPAGTNIKLYEEIKIDMIEPLKTTNTFDQCELQSGDIVCFQKHLPEAEAEELVQSARCADARQFYEYLLNRTTITMYDKNDVDSRERTFDLELSKKMTYDQVAQRVSDHLEVSPTHLRFSSVMQATGRPRPPVKRSPNTTLQSMTSSQTSIYGSTGGAVRPDILMYEVLEISLNELETKKPVKLTYLSDGITKEQVFDVLVPKTGFVRDFIVPLKQKANLSYEDEQRLRFYEVHGCKIFKELGDDDPVAAFNEFITIYAELVPKEEDDAAEGLERGVYCFHFDKELSKVHSVPFKFIVVPNELFKDTKERLSQRTGIKGKNFERIKFAVARKNNIGNKPEYLGDDDVLADKLTESGDQLGLDHLNKTRNVFRGDVMMIR